MPTRREWLKTVAWTASVAGLALPAHLQAQPATGKKVAFLVGVDKYLKPGFGPLTCCERDVVQLEAALRDLGFAQVEVLLGSGTGTKRATKANIEESLQKNLRLPIALQGGERRRAEGLARANQPPGNAKGQRTMGDRMPEDVAPSRSEAGGLNDSVSSGGTTTHKLVGTTAGEERDDNGLKMKQIDVARERTSAKRPR